MSDPAHGRSPLYVAAADCDHDEPPRPGTADDAGWTEWDAWNDNHPPGTGDELICELTQAGWYCPACTAVARAERDLPDWEHVECVENAGPVIDLGYLSLPAEVQAAIEGRG